MSIIQELRPIPPNARDISFLIKRYERYSNYVNFWMALHDYFCNFSMQFRPVSNDIAQLAESIESYANNDFLQGVRKNIDANLRQYRLIREIANLYRQSLNFEIEPSISLEIDTYLERIISVYRLLLSLNVQLDIDEIASSRFSSSSTIQRLLIISFGSELLTSFKNSLNNDFWVDEVKASSREELVKAINDSRLVLIIPPDEYGDESKLTFDSRGIADNLGIPSIMLIIKEKIAFAILPDGLVRIIDFARPETVDWLIDDIKQLALKFEDN
jgi:hypothetical protein